MEIKLLEIILPSEDNSKSEMTVEWIAKSVLPIIVEQEYDAKKLIVKTLTDTPAIYMS